MKKVILLALLLAIAMGFFGCGTTQKKEEKLAGQRQEQRNALLASINYKEIPFDQLRNAISSVVEDGHGFIVQAYVLHPDWMYFTIGSEPPVDEILTVGNLSINMGLKIQNGISVGAQGKFSNIRNQLEADRQYTVYIAVLKETNYGGVSENYNGIVIRIEGIRSVSEVTAAREARQEAQRLEREELHQAEQNRLAELYRQAEQFLGNLRDTSWYFRNRIQNTYEDARIDFGNGNYIIQENQHDLLFAKTIRGSFRVSGDFVIFRSENDQYSFGTILGNTLEYGTGVLGAIRIFR